MKIIFFSTLVLTSIFVWVYGAALRYDASAQQINNEPRFVSLRADEVNVRTGPGVRYPVKWVFVRKFMPVKVIADYDTWRKVRDWEGAEGWIHRAMISGKRHVITIGGLSTLRQSPSVTSRAVAKLENGIVAKISLCEVVWCKLSVGGYGGWLERKSLWGLKTGEVIR